MCQLLSPEFLPVVLPLVLPLLSHHEEAVRKKGTLLLGKLYNLDPTILDNDSVVSAMRRSLCDADPGRILLGRDMGREGFIYMLITIYLSIYLHIHLAGVVIAGVCLFETLVQHEGKRFKKMVALFSRFFPLPFPLLLSCFILLPFYSPQLNNINKNTTPQ